MGVSQYHRKLYSKEEVNNLYFQWLSNTNKLQSLFSENKIFTTYKKWRNNCIRYMDFDSCNYFFFLKEGDKKCPYCYQKFKLEEYSYNRKQGPFHVYCLDCEKKRVYINSETLKKRGKKISEAKINFYKTDKGKEVKISIGLKNSYNMKLFHKTEEGRIQREKNKKLLSELMIKKIYNGEFTPAITNSFTQWNACIHINNKIKNFRSSWEACFWLSNQHLLFETKRIPYILDNKTRNYIVDFFDEKENVIYEIKPKSQWQHQSNKMQQIIDFCQKNDIMFKWINEYNILDYIDESLFLDDRNKKQYKQMLKGIKNAKT